ncbi:MAG: corrinoid protein [Candidatus Bipolaricaulota bacterium]|nr:corrinoid protein [Candidatus Bipolaricaulota bacterium]
MMALYDDLKTAVIDMEVEKAVELTQKGLDEGKDAEDIMNSALVPAMDVVGEQYDKGEKYVPEMLLSAHAMKAAMGLLRPLLVESGVKMKGKVAIGTVEGDLHDIGQNLVGMMLEGAGFEVINLGAETPAEAFVESVKEKKPDIIGMSALLTTTMLHMPEVIDALKENGLREQVKVMIGGAPVTQEYADEIGADGYAPDAASATKLADRLVQ